MELRQVLRARRSIRAFRPDPLPEELLKELVALANWAPSAGNLQSRDFVFVRDAALRRALAHSALDQEFVAQAPAVLVVCTDDQRARARYGKRGQDLYTIQDAAAAAQNFLLAAHDAGLGTAWVGAFDEDAVRRLLKLPRHVRPVALIPVGIPAEHPEPPERLPLSDMLHWDRW